MTRVYHNDKDPWTGKDRGQGPPELDEIFRKMNRRFRKVFGGRGGPSGPNSNGSIGVIIGLVAVILIAIWFLVGLYKVAPAEKGVVLKFGRYEQTVGPGLHWLPPFIKSVNIVNVNHVWHYSYQAEMLTKDKNIVSVKLTVQYRVDKPRNYLFNVIQPRDSLEQVTKSALRQVVGHTKLERILTTGREAVRKKTQKQLVKTLAMYQTGLKLTDVTLQEANPPDEVIDAFDDAIKAREDAERYVNQAQAYRSKVVPKANGKASRIAQSAQAFKQKVILNAKADIQPFLALSKVYKRSPEVTRYRLYMESMEQALKGNRKLLMDSPKQHPMLYMPMPGMKSQGTAQSRNDTEHHSSTSSDHSEQSQSESKHKESGLTMAGRPTSRPSYSGGTS